MNERRSPGTGPWPGANRPAAARPVAGPPRQSRIGKNMKTTLKFAALVLGASLCGLGALGQSDRPAPSRDADDAPPAVRRSEPAGDREGDRGGERAGRMERRREGDDRRPEGGVGADQPLRRRLGPPEGRGRGNGEGRGPGQGNGRGRGAGFRGNAGRGAEPALAGEDVQPRGRRMRESAERGREAFRPEDGRGQGRGPGRGVAMGQGRGPGRTGERGPLRAEVGERGMRRWDGGERGIDRRDGRRMAAGELRGGGRRMQSDRAVCPHCGARPENGRGLGPDRDPRSGAGRGGMRRFPGERDGWGRASRG